MDSVDIEHFEVKVEEHEVKSEPPEYEQIIKSEKDTFNYFNEPLITFRKTTAPKNLDSIDTQQNKRLYTREHCSKTFSQQGNLNEHIRTHTGEKLYACEQCGKSFTTHRELRVHVRTHTGENPYACEHCGKSFS